MLKAKVFTSPLLPGFSEAAVLASDVSLLGSRFDNPSYTIFPGFCDVHVHLREPGFSYKETILQGTKASAHGGYTAVCPMPNLRPVPDSLSHLNEELAIIQRDAVIPTIPYGAITVGEQGETLADLSGMAPYVVAFSDDGKGVQSDSMMRSAMEQAKKLGKIITAHCEVNSLLHGGCIHDGPYAHAHGIPGICSESEWGQIKRDCELARETGCAYHVCHISTKESVDIIRKAKREGVNVTCETAPHYLLLDESCLQDHGRFRMNPPVREARDREALIEGVLDGTIDCIATDHAPHSEEEKSKGLRGSLNGIVGIECAFQVLYTGLVKTGIIPLERIIEMLTVAPRNRFHITADPGITIWDLNACGVVDPTGFLSLGKATPFEGMQVSGKCMKTVVNGITAYEA